MRGLLAASAIVISTFVQIATGTTAMPAYVQRIRILNEEPVIPNGGMSRPQLMTYVTPAYTSAAAESGVVGVVSFLAEFDIDGNFRILRLVNGLGFGLDESALAAVSQWRFQPAFRSGRRVSVVTQIDVAFDPLAQIRMINELSKAFSRAGMRTQIKTPDGTVIVENVVIDVHGTGVPETGSFGGERTTVPQMTISAVF